MWRNAGVWGVVELGVVIGRGFRKRYFCFIYMPAFILSLVADECE